MRNRDGSTTNITLRASNATDSRDGEPVVLMLVESAPVEHAPPRLTQPQNDADAVDALTELLLQPQPDSIQRAVELCAAFLHADLAGLYRVRASEPGLQLIASSELPGEFPVYVEPTDTATTPAPCVWHGSMRPASALTRAARAAGLAALLAHPLGDANTSSGVLLVGYRTPDTVPSDGQVLIRVAARYVHALIVALVRAHANDLRQIHAENVQRHLDTLLSNVGDGVITVDGNGHITHINPAAERMLGFTQREVIGAYVGNVVVDSNPQASDVYHAMQSTDVRKEEHSLVRRDGETLAALVRMAPVPDGSDQLAGGLIVIRDRTEHKTFELQSQSLQQRAFLGDMSAIFAHEVRNPLHGISAGLQYLAMKAPEGDPVHDAVDKMMAEVTRIERLLTDTLQIARPNEMHLQPTDVRAVVERLLYRKGPSLERRQIDYSVEQAEGTPKVTADANLLEHVFTNLIANAMEAIGPDGGAIKVNIHGWRRERPKLGDYVRIDVGDSGPGIPAEALSHIFDLFYTTKREGTGLGLALSKRIVEAHRGTLEVESWAGVGTVFSVYLPAASDAADGRPSSGTHTQLAKGEPG